MTNSGERIRPLSPGNQAPAFTLLADDGSTVALGDFQGKKVVLFFYPKDNTPACTKEAREFRDSWADVQKLGAVLLGVSPDSAASHGKFKRKYSLPFPLLADEDHRVAEAYGVWREMSFLGITLGGIRRTTFIIDEAGQIARVFEKVKVIGHASEVLEALRS